MLCSHFLGQATQHLSVWQSNFGSTALVLVAHFLASEIDETKNTAAIHKICRELLDGFTFLYEDFDPANSENAFQSHFLLQLLAHGHLRPCIGCPDIPKLDTENLKEHGIKGVLSLCCAAVCYSFSPSDGRVIVVLA